MRLIGPVLAAAVAAILSDETADGRFRVRWSKKQGARSCYSVLDQRTGFYVRAFTLADAREAITEIRRRNP